MVLKQESMRGFFCSPGRKKVAVVERWRRGGGLAEVRLYYSKFISSYDEYFFYLYPCSSVETGMN